MKNIGNVCNFFVINDPETLSYRFLRPSTSLLEPLFPQFQTLLYVVENLFASLTLLGRGTENRRQFVPRLPQYPGETSDVRRCFIGRLFVTFGKDQAERNTVFAEHPDKLQIDSLRFEPGVDQYEKRNHIIAAKHIIGDQTRKGPPLILRHPGISISGQIDQIPRVIDLKVVDQAGFSGSGRNFGKPRTICQQIDQLGLTDIRPADKGKLRERIFRILFQLLAAYGKNS